jgi:uncharacterized membrane protein (UPF0127 family)
MRKSLVLALAILASVVAASCSNSQNTAASSTTTKPEAALIGARFEREDGTTCDICVKVANTPELRAKGLQGVKSFDGFDGMLFYSGSASTDAFWMRDVLVPLDIHFFDMLGAPLSTAHGVPCPNSTSDADCPRYKSVAAYGYALEVSPELTKKLNLTGATFTDLIEKCPLAAK